MTDVNINTVGLTASELKEQYPDSYERAYETWRAGQYDINDLLQESLVFIAEAAPAGIKVEADDIRYNIDDWTVEVSWSGVIHMDDYIAAHPDLKGGANGMLWLVAESLINNDIITRYVDVIDRYSKYSGYRTPYDISVEIDENNSRYRPTLDDYISAAEDDEVDVNSIYAQSFVDAHVEAMENPVWRIKGGMFDGLRTIGLLQLISPTGMGTEGADAIETLLLDEAKSIAIAYQDQIKESLRTEYEYLLSEESFIEMYECNGWLLTPEGEIVYE